MSVKDQVNNEAYYGILPMMRKERIYSYWDIVLVTGGFAIATWCYVQGGYVGTMLPFVQSITNIMCSILFAGILIYQVVRIPTRYGFDLWLYQRAIYGFVGATAIFFLCMGSTWGWEAINCRMFANSMVTMASAFDWDISSWAGVLGVFCVFCGWLISLKGPVAVRLANRIMVPCLLAVGLFIMIMVLAKTGIKNLVHMVPMYADYYTGRDAYFLILEANIAFIFSWCPVLGVISRLARTERASYWGHMTGYSFLMAWFICIGAMTGLVMGSVYGIYSTDPTDWLLTLAGKQLGFLSLIFIGFANVTTQAIATYSLTVSTKVMNPRWNYKVVATIWSCFCAILVLWNGVWTYYNIFLAIVGSICVPTVSILLVDFYFIRKKKFSVRSLYLVEGCNSYRYHSGFNLVAFICFFAGIAANFIIYDPINYMARFELFNIVTGTGFNAIVSAGLYFILCQIPAIRRYILKDQKDEEKRVAESEKMSGQEQRA